MDDVTGVYAWFMRVFRKKVRTCESCGVQPVRIVWAHFRLEANYTASYVEECRGCGFPGEFPYMPIREESK